MLKPENIPDSATLLRSIADSELNFVIVDDTLEIRPHAFRDRSYRPSVDWSGKFGMTPARSAMSATDGVAALVASEIRSIHSVIANDSKGRPLTSHNVDVLHRPVFGSEHDHENLAHAQVEAAPAIASKAVFRKLRLALAVLASRGGWCIPPASLRA